MQRISDRSCFDGWLHDGRDIQSRKDQMVVLECGRRRERVRLGEESRPENNTEYDAGEFPSSRPSSTIRSQQREEAYPDLSSLKRDLERAQRERDKAKLDRDSAKLERDQANLGSEQEVLERDQAWSDLSMLRA